MWILTGDPEGVLSSQHAQRLQGALPLAFEALAQQGPDLARLLARDPQLVARARSCALPGSAWLATLEVLNAKADSPIAMGLQPPALCEQAARVLQAVARRRPLLVLLDDLQWADAPSLDMLFHLGRRLQGHRILIVGTFRTGEPDSQSLPRQRPLSGIADEFQRQWGDIRVDLTQAEGRRFVDAYIDGWPNRLGASFRETLFRHTGGNALFAVELVRAMQERGHLLRDGQGRWIDPLNAPDVIAVAPEYSRSGQVVFRNKNRGTNVSGVTPAYTRVRNTLVQLGDFITEQDLDSASRVCVLGPVVAEKLFGAEIYPIGQTIKIGTGREPPWLAPAPAERACRVRSNSPTRQFRRLDSASCLRSRAGIPSTHSAARDHKGRIDGALCCRSEPRSY